MLQLKKFLVLLLISALSLGGTLIPATISFAQQPDYALEANNSAVILDIINAQIAYDQGYTGQGVTLGVIDSPVRTDHIDLIGTTTMEPIVLEDGTIANPSDINWERPNNHGTHVAGIMAAHRNGIGMHGVAYGAKLATTATLGNFGTGSSAGSLYPVNVFNNFFTQNPEVRIINNSWGGAFFPYLPKPISDVSGKEIVWSWNDGHGKKADDFWDLYGGIGAFFYNKEYWETQNIESSYSLAKIALDDPDKLFVWAAGNEGMMSPTEEGLMPRYMGSSLSNWLSVGSLNSSVITRQADGNLLMAPGGFSYYSNQAAGAELWTVFAPGTQIYSADATDVNGFMKSNGTSMAAPVVSGAAGLVEEKFPWMTGKQLADTILTTANSDFTAPEYIVQLQRPATNGAPSGAPYTEDSYFVFTYIDPTVAPANLSPTEAKEMLKEIYDANPEAWGGVPLEVLTAYIDHDRYAVSTATKEEVFGQGILDVGKAMGGVAELNANRMTADNVYSVAALQNPVDAYETFDTQGYNAEFSNDISQMQWDDNYHHPEFQYNGGSDTGYNSAALQLYGKNVGFHKAGAGRLILSGENTYAGATLVTGGELTIARRDDGSGGILENSDVYVGEETRLSGNGIIVNSLTNYGTVSPGLNVATFASPSLQTAASMTTEATAAPLLAAASMTTEATASTPQLAAATTTSPSAALDILTVGTYTQKSSGSLEIYFDTQGRSKQLALMNNDSNIEGGSLTFVPTTGFYQGSQNLTVFTGSGAIPTGNFTTIQHGQVSPVLDFAITQNSNSNYDLTTARHASAYSQYAQSTSAQNLGETLVPLASVATGNLQNLFTALDFSAPDGHEVKSAITQLSAETYDLAAQASFKQQNTLNRFLWQHATIEANETQGAFAPVSGDYNASSVGIWGHLIGSWGNQGANGGVSGYDSESVGLMTGFDWHTDLDGFTTGLNFAFSKRDLTDFDYHHANVETESFSLGLSAHYSPSQWEGFYALAQGRLGFEQNDLSRTVVVGADYIRHNKSSWTDFSGSALLGGGHDWTKGLFTFGPLAWLEYSFLNRPNIGEHGGSVTSLQIKDGDYNSLRSSLGFHLAYNNQVSDSFTLDLAAMATWQHELLDNNFSSTASLAGYGDYLFTSDTPLMGQNIYALEANMRLTSVNNYFMQVNLGGELTDDSGENLYLGLNFGYNF